MPKSLTLATLLALATQVALGSVTSVQSAQTRTEPPGPHYSLEITPNQAEIKSGSPLTLTVVLKNITNHDIPYFRENAQDRGGTEYLIDVWDDKLAEAERTKLGKALKGREDPSYLTSDTPLDSSGVQRTLKVGESVTDQISVSRIYDLSKPGKYTIQVRQIDDVSGFFVKSNKVTVTIKP